MTVTVKYTAWCVCVWPAARMAGKSQTSAAHQTMKFVYSEAVNRSLRHRCRGLATAAADNDDGPPPLPPEILLAVLQSSGDVDLGAAAVSGGKSGAGRLPTDATDAVAAAAAAAAEDVDYEISNLAEIYREISRAVEQVRRRSTANDASASAQHDRPVTRAGVAASSKTPTTGGDDRNKPSTARSTPRLASLGTIGKDADKRQKDGKKVQFSTIGKQESNGE